MTFNKGGNILKFEKKDWFSHKTILVFLHGDVFKNGSRNSVTFKMESLQKLVMVGLTKNWRQYLQVF